jgi:hypothetical protein
LLSKGSLEETEIQQIEENYNLNLLELTNLKSIAIIFSKIILISDSKYFGIRIEKYAQSLLNFIEKNSINFLSKFNLQLDYNFLSEFNGFLSSPEAKELFGVTGIPGAFAPYPHTAYNSENSIVNIKNYTKTLFISDDEYFYGVLSSLDNLSFSFNYFIDLKELYISMKNKNYNMLIFFEFFEKLFRYNYSVSQAEASTNALTSIAHLFGLICSIGFNDTISTSYLFSDNITHKLANSKEKKLAEEIMLKDKETFIKVNFDLIRTLYASKYENFLKFCEANLLSAAGGSALEVQNPFVFRSSDRQQENFYLQFYSYKYDILFYVVEYLKTQFNLGAEMRLDGSADKTAANKVNFVNLSKIPSVIKEEEFETLNINYAKIHEFLLNKSLVSLIDELALYLKAYSSEENEKCIFSIMNLIHSIFTFLVVTDYQPTSEAHLNILNSVVNALMSFYNNLNNYSNTLILIICAYMNLTNNIIETFAESEKIIGNFIPLLEANRANSDEYTLIRVIMRKLKQDISNTNLLILLQFLSLFVKSYGLNAIEVIISEKILLAFILNDPFENSFSLGEYEENERGTKHILWCWTWTFFKNILLCVSENEESLFNSVYSLIIEFIVNHERRVFSVLGNSEYSDVSGNTLQKSLAFVEELECITNVLNLLFVENRKWKNSFYDFYMKVVLCVIEKSIKLNIPNVKISNHFKCYSNYEHRMNEVINFFIY